MRLTPARKVAGSVSLPGDKSISHRAAIIAALANGISTLSNFATSRDCASTLSCLRQLGVPIVSEGHLVRIEGIRSLRAPSVELDCGNSGSTMRMLAGILAGQSFTSIMTGDSSLSERPMARIIRPLQEMGAQITSEEGKPPLTITGSSNLQPIDYELEIASAQVKSCILFAALCAAGTTTVRERQRTRDHTERLLSCFGVSVTSETLQNGATQISLTGAAIPQARNLAIPGDVSSAAFLIAAAGLLPESQLEIRDVGLNPTRTEFLSVLQFLGFEVAVEMDRQECNEPVGTIRVNGRKYDEVEQSLVTNVLTPEQIPQLIDELPLLAVVGTRVTGGISIRNARELRFKESDRIAATVSNLRAMGVAVDEFPDGLSVPGPQKLKGARIDSHGDHRIAMAFTVASLIAEGESELLDADCVAISFPEFFEILDSITVSI